MSASKVLGKNVVLKLFNNDGYYIIYCAQEVSVSLDTEQLAATSVGAGGWKRSKPGRSSYSLDISGITYVKDSTDSNWVSFELTQAQVRQNGLDFLLTLTNENDSHQEFSGHINIVNTSFTGVAAGGQFSKFSHKFIGDGALTLNASIPSSIPNEVFQYLYEAAGGETFFTYAGLQNRTILAVTRESNAPVRIILSGTPAVKEAKYTPGLGKLEFNTSNPFGQGEFITVLYK